MPTRVEVKQCIKSGKVLVLPGEYELPLATEIGAVIQREIRADSPYVRVLGSFVAPEAIAEGEADQGDNAQTAPAAPKPRTRSRSR